MCAHTLTKPPGQMLAAVCEAQVLETSAQCRFFLKGTEDGIMTMITDLWRCAQGKLHLIPASTAVREQALMSR